MSIKIEVEFTHTSILEIPVDSFDDILFGKMSEEDSDEIINDALYKKYKFTPDTIRVIKEITNGTIG